MPQDTTSVHDEQSVRTGGPDAKSTDALIHQGPLATQDAHRCRLWYWPRCFKPQGLKQLSRDPTDLLKEPGMAVVFHRPASYLNDLAEISNFNPVSSSALAQSSWLASLSSAFGDGATNTGGPLISMKPDGPKYSAPFAVGSVAARRRGRAPLAADCPATGHEGRSQIVVLS